MPKNIGKQQTYGMNGKQMPPKGMPPKGMPPKGMHRMEGGRMMKDEDMPMNKDKKKSKKK